MFTSEPLKVDPEAVEDFHLPPLEFQEKPLSRAAEFQLFDFGGPPSSLQMGGVASQAEKILAAAHLKAQEIEQQAYEDGFQQGQADGQEVGRRALEEIVKRLQDLVANLEQDQERLFRERERVLLDLVLLISEKLLARELRLHPEDIRHIIEEGFRQAAHQEGLRLLVSPLDYEVLQQVDMQSWPREVEVLADAMVNPGGFRLETSLGEVDGTRETRWALVVQAVEQALETLHESDSRD